MKKTRFFYEINYFLIVLLGWLLLFNKAVEVNRAREKTGSATWNGYALGIAGAGGIENGMTVGGKHLQGVGENQEVSEGQEGSTDQEVKKAKNVNAAQKTDGVQNTGSAEATENDGLPGTAESGEERPSTLSGKIRVLLMDSSYQSYYHSSVTLNLNGVNYEYTPDSPELSQGEFVLDGGEAGITITSIERQESPPVYCGTLEIQNTPQGLLLINELPLETYLEGVVPSEMPASYESQALMAQAVCARTYAVCQMEEGSLQEEYGADVDDSVNFQVYGNIAPTDKTSQAVRETNGQIMCQDGKPVTAYYFSTSSGRTSTDEIWGGTPSSYLKSVECEFDQNAPWSSWKVTIPWTILEERTKNLTGSESLKSIQVVKKSESGAVTGLQITTEKEAVQLEGEYEIREFLSPQGQAITEKDGSTVTGGSLLPSSYFQLKGNKGDCVEITGGGFGHGVGMSQTAANEMAKEGYSWQEILEYFFQDITLDRYE